MDQAQSELLATLHAFTLRHGSEKGILVHFKSYVANSPQVDKVLRQYKEDHQMLCQPDRFE